MEPLTELYQADTSGMKWQTASIQRPVQTTGCALVESTYQHRGVKSSDNYMEVITSEGQRDVPADLWGGVGVGGWGWVGVGDGGKNVGPVRTNIE